MNTVHIFIKPCRTRNKILFTRLHPPNYPQSPPCFNLLTQVLAVAANFANISDESPPITRAKPQTLGESDSSECVCSALWCESHQLCNLCWEDGVVLQVLIPELSELLDKRELLRKAPNTWSRFPLSPVPKNKMPGPKQGPKCLDYHPSPFLSH